MSVATRSVMKRSSADASGIWPENCRLSARCRQAPSKSAAAASRLAPARIRPSQERGTAIGPVVGGVLVQNVGWQSIFLLNVPVGLIGIALSAWAISESYDERAPRTVDLFGLATSAVCVLCLALALVQGNDPDKGWTSPYILALFGGALVAFVAFVVGELRIRYPMADPRLFTIRSFTGSAIVAFTVSAGLQGAGSRYTHLPFFPGLSHIARSAFVDGTIDILRIAAGLVALGLLASALLVRRTDLHQEKDGARPVAAA